MSILGNRVIRKEDPNLLRGRGKYTANMADAATLHVSSVRSQVAHGRVVSVDVTEARQAPGVVAVFTAGDLDWGPLPGPTFFPQIDARFTRWPLAKDVVRYVGEPIVAMVTETQAQGADAAELVVIDIEPLPVVPDLDASMRNEILLFPDLGTNVVATLDLPLIDGLFDAADVVVELTMENSKLAPAPLEGRALIASLDGTDLTIRASTQGVNVTRFVMAMQFGIDPANVHVITEDVGGGFGSKGGASPEELVTVWIAIQLGGPDARAVRFVEARRDNLLAMTHGRGQRQTMRIGATHDGLIVGLHMDIAQEAGAHPEIGSGLPAMTMLMSAGTYRVPRIQYTSRSWVTNTTPVGAFRGAGRPEAAYAIERTMDVLARRLHLDPAELRRRNLIAPFSEPHTTAVGTVYDCGDYAEALRRVLEASNYDELRHEQERRRAAGDRMLVGIGLSTYVEITGNMPGAEPGRVVVHADGTATVYTGSTPHGQGHVTSWAMIASDRLGIPFEQIDVVWGDTDRVPAGGVTGGSRSLQVCGTVVGRASDAVVEQARALAASLLEANVDDVVLDKDAGRFHVAGTPSVSRSWVEVVAASSDGDLDAEVAFDPPSATFPFGANVAVVEVDADTGHVQLLRLVGCDDAGTVLNPLLFEGQLHGGMAHGASQALLEYIAYDQDGNPLTSNFADYTAVSAAELPLFELVHMETPTPVNELGAKGIGESGSVGSTPAVINAVVDALAHLGVEHLDMPATPERVWRVIQSATSGV
jgi:carbon-monoxide dehydrogenase large subunit